MGYIYHYQQLSIPPTHITLSFICLTLQNMGLKELKEEDNTEMMCILKKCLLQRQDKTWNVIRGRLNMQTMTFLPLMRDSQPFNHSETLTSH